MLGNSELIRHLPINLIEEAVKNIKEKHLVAGDRVFSEGDPGNIVYFIESGSVAITRSENKIATLNVGDIMGEISILTDASRTATATAETDIKLLLMGKEDFDHWRDLSRIQQGSPNLSNREIGRAS